MVGGLNVIGYHETQPRSPCCRAGGSTTAALLHPTAVPTEGKGAGAQEGCPCQLLSPVSPSLAHGAGSGPQLLQAASEPARSRGRRHTASLFFMQREILFAADPTGLWDLLQGWAGAGTSRSCRGAEAKVE